MGNRRQAPATVAAREDALVELSSDQPIFVGFRLDGSLRRQIESLSGPDRQYVSSEDSTFLVLCRRGEDSYVGKIVEDGLSTDRVEDVRRNVLSIMRRLLPDVRLPNTLEILPVKSGESPETNRAPSEGASADPPEPAW
jgi:hypothetical protein